MKLFSPNKEGIMNMNMQYGLLSFVPVIIALSFSIANLKGVARLPAAFVNISSSYELAASFDVRRAMDDRAKGKGAFSTERDQSKSMLSVLNLD